FDPAARDKAGNAIASLAVWFDAFITNIDRTARNPNLLYWHKVLYFIDHGAALYFHHDWDNATENFVTTTFPQIKHHVLLPWASAVSDAAAAAQSCLNRDVFAGILDAVPDAWLSSEKRTEYVDLLTRRLDNSGSFIQEIARARAELV